MNRALELGVALAAATVAAASLAQEDEVYDRVSLGTSASAEVENDLLIATVFAEVEDNDQADASSAVNETIAWAAARARDVSGIEIRTTNYTTRPVYANERRIVGWIARQGLRLESQDAAALSELLGELQQRVAVESINFSLSNAARNAAEEVLIAEALAQFNRRAELIATELGRNGFKIVQINVGASGANPFARERFAAQVAQSADGFFAPELEAGNQVVSVTVNGTVELATEP
jgi:predicted secreted protein